jgi:hypothetical protein
MPPSLYCTNSTWGWHSEGFGHSGEPCVWRHLRLLPAGCHYDTVLACCEASTMLHLHVSLCCIMELMYLSSTDWRGEDWDYRSSEGIDSGVGRAIACMGMQTLELLHGGHKQGAEAFSLENMLLGWRQPINHEMRGYPPKWLLRIAGTWPHPKACDHNTGWHSCNVGLPEVGLALDCTVVVMGTLAVDCLRVRGVPATMLAT